MKIKVKKKIDINGIVNVKFKFFSAESELCENICANRKDPYKMNKSWNVSKFFKVIEKCNIF